LNIDSCVVGSHSWSRAVTGQNDDLTVLNAFDMASVERRRKEQSETNPD
jgi:hypothetical protein